MGRVLQHPRSRRPSDLRNEDEIRPSAGKQLTIQAGSATLPVTQVAAAPARLALVGVEPEAIADDYALSTGAVRALFAAVGREDEGPAIEAGLARRGTTARAAILATLNGFDARQYLLGAGVSPVNLAAIETRLVG